jgi:hypothetical protein
MAVQGLVRLRRHLFGRQAAFGTKVPATKAYPFSGVPDVDLTWTDPDVDEGSIDPVSPPFRGPGEYTASLDDPALKYNHLPLMHSGVFGDDVEAVTGGSGQKTWTFEPASLTVDAVDVHTYQFGDDVLTDWYQLGDGVLETLEITGSRDPDGPLTASMSWRFGSASSTGSTDSPVTGTVPTAGLSVATDDVMVYLKDGSIFIASDIADIATSQVSDALHAFTLRITNEFDQKRYANGSQLFDIDDYGRASRLIELECTFAKTADTVGTGSESDAWFSDDSVNRYVRLHFISTSMAAGAVPYSWMFTLPLRYYTRTEGEVGGNTVIVLTGHAFYDPGTFAGVFKSVIVNTLVSIDGAGS